jgi:hypothetical protein
VELCSTNAIHFYARVYQKTIIKIQAHHAAHATLPVYSPEPKRYGAETQSPLLQDDTRKLNEKEIKQVQTIVGSILYYTRVVDMMVLLALSTIASEQTKGMERTL